MNNILKVQCDKCNKDFLITSDNIKVGICEINERKFQVMYFSCSNCGEITKFVIKDFECIKLTDEIQDLNDRIQRLEKINDKKKIKELKRRRFKKQMRLGVRIEKLNDKFTGEFEISNEKLIYHE